MVYIELNKLDVLFIIFVITLFIIKQCLVGIKLLKSHPSKDAMEFSEEELSYTKDLNKKNK